jgi:hypothetical protein
MSVQDIEIDLIKYSGRKDFQVLTEWLSCRSYAVTVRRLDGTEGWTENIKVLACFPNESSTIVIGPSQAQEKRLIVETTFDITQSTTNPEPLITYDPLQYPTPQKITNAQFNRLFTTDIVPLPNNLFAVGIKNGATYIYNETYEFLYMIELTIKHIVGVALKENLFREQYFLICAYDGYLEGHYPSLRNVPYTPKPNEYKGQTSIQLQSANTFPRLHKELTVLGQSVQARVEGAISVPDRYYFYLNRYNEYRSIHCGLLFDKKINQIAYGSQPRGTKFNFTNRRDISVSQREYFYSAAVPKTNIIAPQWIDRADMIKYKYLLDIDGNASTWDATAWKLNSGSVILKVDSEWNQWFYDLYKPWTHYVPVKDDFSNLQEQYAWCEQNQDECRKMIKNCKELFQQAYRFHNVMANTRKLLLDMNRLTPISVGQRRLFIFSQMPPSKKYPAVQQVKQADGLANLIVTTHNICKRLFPTDIIMYANVELLDAANFEPNDFLERYDSFGKKIVFGAERNLWPESLEIVKFKIEQLAPKENAFKYLNAGFFCAEVGEMQKLLDERVYEPDRNLIDQEYFVNALLSQRFSMCLDYNQKLVINTFRCTKSDVDSCLASKVPFVHHNGGR